MDSGWAVVIGAVIALAGSTLIPWLRETLSANRVHSEAAQVRRRDAVVDLLAANGRLGVSSAFEAKDASRDAFTQRSRAAARVLMEANAQDRGPISTVLDLSWPVPRSGAPAEFTYYQRMLALQTVMSAWVSGEVSGREIENTYRAEVAKVPEGTSEATAKIKARRRRHLSMFTSWLEPPR